MQPYRQVDERTRSLEGREATDAFVYPTVGWLFTSQPAGTETIRANGSFFHSGVTTGTNPRKYPHAMEGK